MILRILDWAFSKIGGSVIGAGFAGLLFVAFVNQQRNIGAAKATAAVTKATHDTSRALSAAADRSRDPGVRGKRDPSTRDD